MISNIFKQYQKELSSLNESLHSGFERILDIANLLGQETQYSVSQINYMKASPTGVYRHFIMRAEQIFNTYIDQLENAIAKEPDAFFLTKELATVKLNKNELLQKIADHKANNMPEINKNADEKLYQASKIIVIEQKFLADFDAEYKKFKSNYYFDEMNKLISPYARYFFLKAGEETPSQAFTDTSNLETADHNNLLSISYQLEELFNQTVNAVIKIDDITQNVNAQNPVEFDMDVAHEAGKKQVNRINEFCQSRFTNISEYYNGLKADIGSLLQHDKNHKHLPGTDVNKFNGFGAEQFKNSIKSNNLLKIGSPAEPELQPSFLLNSLVLASRLGMAFSIVCVLLIVAKMMKPRISQHVLSVFGLFKQPKMDVKKHEPAEDHKLYSPSNKSLKHRA